MIERRRLFANAVWRSSAIVGAKLMAFFFMILAGRWIGVERFGYLVFSLATCQIVFVIMDMGISLALVKTASQYPSKGSGWFESALRMRGYTLPVGFGVLLLMLKVIDVPPEARWLVLALGLSTGTDAIGRLFSSMYVVAQDLRTDARATLVGRAVFFLFGVAMIKAGGSIFWIGVAHLAGNMVTVWILSARAPIIATPRFVADKELDSTKQLLAVAWPLGLVDLFTVIYFRVDQLMLEHWSGAQAVGLYGAAYRLIETAMVLPAALLVAAFPEFVRAASSNHGLRRDSLQVGSFLFAMALVGSVFGVMWAEPLCVMFFGPEFSGSGPLLRILLIALVLIYPNYLFTKLMVASGLQKKFMKIAMICAVFNVLANLLLIPGHGPVGAAWTTVATEVILCVGARGYLIDKIGPPRLQNLVVGLLLGTVSLLAGYAFNEFVSQTFAMVGHFTVCLVLAIGSTALIRTDKKNR